MLSFVFFIASVVLTKVYCFVAEDTRLMDKPNERSMHSKPTIRGGGLVFITLTLLAMPFLGYLNPAVTWQSFALSVLMVAGVSFADDLYHLAAKPRFLIQCLVALLFVLFLQPRQLEFGFFTLCQPILIVPFIFICVIWAVNHFNFMDGIDGFCAAQAGFLCGAYALLFGLHDAFFYQSLCCILMACLAGFLLFNFPPARLFMGDVGSATLGLITFGLALIGQKYYHIPMFYWFMLNGLFLFDATITLIRRVIKKEKWSAPHKKHAYQRLRRSGITVQRILFGQLVLNAVALVLVWLVNVNLFYSVIAILTQFGIIFVIYWCIEKIFPMFNSELTS